MCSIKNTTHQIPWNPRGLVCHLRNLRLTCEFFYWRTTYEYKWTIQNCSVLPLNTLYYQTSIKAAPKSNAQLSLFLADFPGDSEPKMERSVTSAYNFSENGTVLSVRPNPNIYTSSTFHNSRYLLVLELTVFRTTYRIQTTDFRPGWYVEVEYWTQRGVWRLDSIEVSTHSL